MCIVLVRNDVGGQRGAEKAAGLARSLSFRLPQVSLQELVFQDSDSRLLDASKEFGKKEVADAKATAQYTAAT